MTTATSVAVPPRTYSLLSIREVEKRFGARPVLRNISLEVASGEFLTILGESGSGKTTLLRLIRARILNQTFGGAMDTLELDCGGSQSLRARVASPGPLSGEREFEFRASDAIAVRNDDSA
jgi:ABC-type bacteriocin/lantibiotic exporter with double-glycine peptidase domain